MNYNNYTFRYPKLTRTAKAPTDKITFTDCDFRAVDKMKITGFTTVNFNGYSTELRKPTKIEIENCDKIMFTNVDFNNDQITLIIKKAKSVYFEAVYTTRGLNLQTENCDIIGYIHSSLNFDTSKMNTKKFVLGGSQVSSLKKLDLTGVTQRLQIYTTNVFDLQEMLICPQVELYIDSAYDTKRILQPITRFQER